MVSLDDDKNAWIRNGIQKLNPPGLNLWAIDNKQVTSDFQVFAIPRSILVDKEGNLIEFNAPRSSDATKALSDLISSYLIK
jgi:hypothetical protein